MKHWVLLAAAIVCEVVGTTCMKFSDGFTKPVPSILLFVFYAVAFVLLTLAVEKIDLGTAYAVWAGAGTALVVMIGIVFLGDSLTVTKLVCVALIIAGVVGLKVSEESAEKPAIEAEAD